MKRSIAAIRAALESGEKIKDIANQFGFSSLQCFMDYRNRIGLPVAPLSDVEKYRKLAREIIIQRAT